MLKRRKAKKGKARQFQKSGNILELKHKELYWVNITKPGDAVNAWLQNKFNFLDIDLKETLPPLQRPKLVERPGYLFMILLFPVFDRKLGEIRSSEVDFFIGKNFIITIHSNELEPLKKIWQECSVDNSVKNLCFNADPTTLIYEILNNLLEDASKMLVHVSTDLDEIELKLFSGFEQSTIGQLLRIKTNIVNLRKSMQGHKNVMRKLITAAPKFFPITKLENYFHNLVDKTKEVWDALENYKDTADALHETNSSFINFKINEIMKTLTIIAVITFPLTLFATVSGLSLAGNPFHEQKAAFWIVVGVLLAVTFIMVGIFDRKKWL